MTVYPELKALTEQIHILNTDLQSRLDDVEQWQSKIQRQLDSGNYLPAESHGMVNDINEKIRSAVGTHKALLMEQKEALLAAQRPGVSGGGLFDRKSPETKAFLNYIRKRGDVTAMSDRERAMIDFNRMDFSSMDAETKIMTATAADLGGLWVGSEFQARLIQKIFLVSPIRQLCTVSMIGAEKLLLPSETSQDAVASWSDEQSGYQTSTDIGTGLIDIYARELNTYIRVSNQVLEDQAYDLEGFVMGRLSRQFAQKEGTAFISGNGVSRPEGITTNTLINSFTSVTASNIVPTDIIQVMHKGKSGYRKNGTWLMSNNTIGVLRLFKDSQNRPLAA